MGDILKAVFTGGVSTVMGGSNETPASNVTAVSNPDIPVAAVGDDAGIEGAKKRKQAGRGVESTVLANQTLG